MKASQQAFIETIGSAAVKYYPTYRILPSLVIAQAIKESDWGSSGLSQSCYNYFGMKWAEGCGCDYKTYKTKEWDKATQSYIEVYAKFRKYKNPDEGIKGYYQFLSGYKRYQNLKGITDSQKACMTIQADGYATAPDYGQSLYNNYVLKYNLLKYDAIALGTTPVQDIDVKSYPTLKLNDNNEYVLAWQKFLNLKGYTLVEDGIFGKNTLEAVKDWQHKNGLVSDGIIGPKTWNTVK